MDFGREAAARAPECFAILIPPFCAGCRAVCLHMRTVEAEFVRNIARSGNPGIAQAHMFIVFAAVLIGCLPLVFLVPEHRGRW